MCVCYYFVMDLCQHVPVWLLLSFQRFVCFRVTSLWPIKHLPSPHICCRSFLYYSYPSNEKSEGLAVMEGKQCVGWINPYYTQISKQIWGYLFTFTVCVSRVCINNVQISLQWIVWLFTCVCLHMHVCGHIYICQSMFCQHRLSPRWDSSSTMEYISVLFQQALLFVYSFKAPSGRPETDRFPHRPLRW